MSYRSLYFYSDKKLSISEKTTFGRSIAGLVYIALLIPSESTRNNVEISIIKSTMADEDTPHTNGNGHEENGHVPEIELIIKVNV